MGFRWRMRSDLVAVWRESLESHSRLFDLCLLRLHQLWTSDLLYRPRLLIEKHSVNSSGVKRVSDQRESLRCRPALGWKVSITMSLMTRLPRCWWRMTDRSSSVLPPSVVLAEASAFSPISSSDISETVGRRRCELWHQASTQRPQRDSRSKLRAQTHWVCEWMLSAHGQHKTRLITIF